MEEALVGAGSIKKKDQDRPEDMRPLEKKL